MGRGKEGTHLGAHHGFGGRASSKAPQLACGSARQFTEEGQARPGKATQCNRGEAEERTTAHRLLGQSHQKSLHAGLHGSTGYLAKPGKERRGWLAKAIHNSVSERGNPETEPKDSKEHTEDLAKPGTKRKGTVALTPNRKGGGAGVLVGMNP